MSRAGEVGTHIKSWLYSIAFVYKECCFWKGKYLAFLQLAKIISLPAAGDVLD
jgi:hypothetical protein